MCGIAGLFLKTNRYHEQLGRLTSLMLKEMCERGPDSAGFSIYSPATPGLTKVTALCESRSADWRRLADLMEKELGGEITVSEVHDHALFTSKLDGGAIRQWLIDHAEDVSVTSHGGSIETYKAVGYPMGVAERYGLADRVGTHAIAHTRMATESAVTTNGSHPFSTGRDTCLVHNGSLSNHNLLREILESKGETFQTENDSEVAAGYLAWRLREGDTLTEALERALEDLDGFYTFCIGTADGFAVLRDPIACKPAVMAETDDWVAMASEFRALARLPGIDEAEMSEPEPARVLVWSHE